MSSLLKTHHLSFAYGQRLVLSDVEMALAAGEVVALLGHLRPRDGEVIWDNKPLRRWGRRELARAVAYLPQSPAWVPGQSVADVLRLGRAPYWGAFGVESAADVAIVRRIAQMLLLDELLDRPIDELSGGQRQRVFVGRALAQEPRAMLLDEPNTFLDLRHQVDLAALLRTLSRESNVAVLMASHDLNLAGMFADRLVLLEQGKVAAAGTPAEVLQPELLTRVYGVPIDRITAAPDRPVVLPRVGRSGPWS
jgi:iron complex transport system ATP-binding protein